MFEIGCIIKDSNYKQVGLIIKISQTSDKDIWIRYINSMGFERFVPAYYCELIASRSSIIQNFTENNELNKYISD